MSKMYKIQKICIRCYKSSLHYEWHGNITKFQLKIVQYYSFCHVTDTYVYDEPNLTRVTDRLIK